MDTTGLCQNVRQVTTLSGYGHNKAISECQAGNQNVKQVTFLAMNITGLYQNVKQVTFLAMNTTGLYQNVKQVTISGDRHNRAISERQAVDSLWLWGYACTRCSKQVIVCRKVTVAGYSSRYTLIPLTWTPRLCCMITILIRVRQHLLL